MELKLEENSKVAVIGGGPAGSFFSYFLLELAERTDLSLSVDIFEPKNFQSPGPSGCNMCAGIISESLIQILAAEGINIPLIVAQRGISSYVLHTPYGDTEIRTPDNERRIATVYRGAGPRDLSKTTKWQSFDGHLMGLAVEKGARQKRDKVEQVKRREGRLEINTKSGLSEAYDLVVVATGLYKNADKMFSEMDLNYKPPRVTKAHLREFNLGQDQVDKFLGNRVHIFLLDIPRLEFAAFVPKGDYVTLCLIGDRIDGELIDDFMARPQVKQCLPAGVDPKGSCRCSPNIFLRAATEPYGDRIVFLGDSGVSRLYKDGIGAAYRTAKAAATTAIFQGVSLADFERHYWPTCRRIKGDNRIGQIIFAVNGQIQKSRLTLGGVLRMVDREQNRPGKIPRMSGVLWDTFTGSAPYRDIFSRTLHPFFQSRFVAEVAREIVSPKHSGNKLEA